ncbi:MAG: hydroxyisourate hydrolase [Alphaproteobacteria bacterium]
MGRLTTHILDTANGCPASGVRIDLFSVDDDGALTDMASATTNSDGRVDGPVLEGDAFVAGVYELQFHVGAYFAGATALDGPAFLDVVPVRFGIAATDEHYHVPLLISPFGYSTYRGS